ncbi:metalloprotease m41 ftsh [Holotrichia oblita]|nr:metalloprotease m41 ftsh [Holotrichia oblita]
MSPAKIKLDEVIRLFENDEVASCIISKDNLMTITTKSGEIKQHSLRSLDLLNQRVGDKIMAGIANETIKYDEERAQDMPFWTQFIPYIIAIALMVVLWMYFMNQATGKNGKISSFGKSKAKLGSEEKKKVYFADVSGCEEEKEELREVVDFLKNPLKFIQLGARIPRGVLLVGPPGTGKTMLAKAVAGEAGVPFYSTSGSEFVEMYVGVGASRVRDIFTTAKKNNASIIFIDEIDAVGRHRGAGLGGGHDEREQTLNQLLVEMDGFGNNEGVIVIAATNRPDILDPALLRRNIKVHAKGKPFENDVQLDVIAKTTAGFTGADLANLLNEAALLAARKQKRLIGMNDLEEAMIKVMVGPQKKSKVISEREKRITAYHEAGHAIATYFQKTQDPVHQISIIPSGSAGGYTMSLPKEDKIFRSKKEMEEDIVTLLGGRVAEKIIMDDISTGASNDIQRVSTTARKMITQYGMSDKLGPIVFGTGHEEVFLGREFNSSKNYSEKIASEIDDEVKQIVDTGYASAETILLNNRDKLEFIAQFLIKNEIMDGEQFKAAMEGETSYEALEAMASERRKRSEEENRLARERSEQRAKEESAKREEMLKKEKEDLINSVLNGEKELKKNDEDDNISFPDGDNL